MFGFFKKRIEKKSAPVYVGYGTPPSLWGSAPESASGIAVTPATSLECATVLACVRLLANGMAQVPFRLFRMNKSGIRNPAVDHPLYDLLYSSPNEYQTAFEFFHTIMMHLSLTGNAYIWINRRADGKVLELLPYPPHSVAISRDGWEVKYSIRTQDGQWVELPADDMWHIRWLAWDGVAGLSAVKMARDAIGLALALDSHGSTSFKNGSRIGGVLTVAQRLDEDQRKSLREAWQAAFGGSGESGKVAVLGADMKYQPIQATNDVSQYDQSRRYQVEEICRAFGVDPVMIGYSEKTATFASVEQKSINHVVYTLGPWYSCLEKSANKWLLTKQERSFGLYFKFNTNALMRGAATDRASFYTSLYNIGALSPNEIRELEDMNPYDGGDEHRVPLNMAAPGEEPEPEEEKPSKEKSDENE